MSTMTGSWFDNLGIVAGEEASLGSLSRVMDGWTEVDEGICESADSDNTYTGFKRSMETATVFSWIWSTKCFSFLLITGCGLL